MRRTFLLWLSLLLLAVFAVTGAMTYLHMREHAHERAEQMLRSGLSDMLALLQYDTQHAELAKEESEAAALQRTRALVELLSRDAGLLQGHDKLQEMGNLLGAEQMVITDGKGNIATALPKTLEGRALTDCGPLRNFAACDSGEETECCTAPSPGKSDELQYAGVARHGAAGAVILGFHASDGQRHQSEENYTKLADSYTVGSGGYIAVFRGGNLLNRASLPFAATELLMVPKDEVVRLELGGTEYYAYSMADNRYKLVALVPVNSLNSSGLRSLRTLFVSNVLLFLMMFAAVSLLLQHYVIAGLRRVNESLRRIASGDLDERVEEESLPEFQRLSSDINAMVDTLRFFGEEEREDRNRELELARSIQSAALPERFPAFPTHTEFDLFAACIPAMTVGGDFYDFAMPSEERLNFLVADISASGIPAALYMMRCMSLIRSVSRTGAKPETLVRQVNRALCEGQTEGFHLSLFYGSLNVTTGELRYVNAGAPQALLRHADGEYEPMEMVSGPMMGLFEDAAYTGSRMQLQPGDSLFLYTQGVIMAANAENKPFGIDGLREALNGTQGGPTEAVREVRTALRTFLHTAEPQEDITMLTLEYRGIKRSRGELAVTAGAPEGLTAMLEEHLEAVFAAPADMADIQATTAAVLAALPPDTAATVALNSTEAEAELNITYAAPRFNPLISLPHLPMEKVAYSYDEESGNRLTFTKKLS